MQFTTGFRHRTTTRGRVASEAAGSYAAGDGDDLAGFEAREEAPTPPLAEILELSGVSDRVMARMVTLVQRLHRSGEVEATTGLPIEAWLARHGRLARADRRMVQTAADVLADMPHTQHGFNDGRISWGQIRSVVLSCRPLKAFDRRVVDQAIAEVLDQATSWEPDELVWRVEHLVAGLDHRREERAEQRAVEGSFVAMQPRLDGSGGTLYADFDALGYGIVDQAFTARMGLPDGLRRSADDHARSRNAKAIGRARADALIGICADSLAGTTPTTGARPADDGAANDADDVSGQGPANDPDVQPPATTPSTPGTSLTSPTPSGPAKPAVPLILATLTLDDLLGLSHGPAGILTTLTGGRLNLTSSALRELVEEGGAAIRAIVLDDNGRAVGVGRRNRFAPGWLKEASLALHQTCLVPGCAASARICDADHATGVADSGAPTDLNEIGPWCRAHRRWGRGRGASPGAGQRCAAYGTNSRPQRVCRRSAAQRSSVR